MLKVIQFIYKTKLFYAEDIKKNSQSEYDREFELRLIVVMI